jgi:hypothetical protein
VKQERWGDWEWEWECEWECECELASVHGGASAFAHGHVSESVHWYERKEYVRAEMWAWARGN